MNAVVDMRERVLALQDVLLTMEQADIVTEHCFLPGIYERKITIPPWTVLTGAQHKSAYRVRLEKGTIAVNTDDGVKILHAPCEFDVKAGMQRAGRVFEREVVWVDIYENLDNCRNLSTLEARLYVVPEIGMGSTRLAVAHARSDYLLFLEQIGLNQKQLDGIVQSREDLMDMPDGYDVELRASSIHGVGLFALRCFEAGELVCPGRLNGYRTPAGRYINHSVHANITPIKAGDDIHAQASREIYEGDELLVDYRASMRVNFGLTLHGEF